MRTSATALAIGGLEVSSQRMMMQLVSLSSAGLTSPLFRPCLKIPSGVTGRMYVLSSRHELK